MVPTNEKPHIRDLLLLLQFSGYFPYTRKRGSPLNLTFSVMFCLWSVFITTLMVSTAYTYQFMIRSLKQTSIAEMVLVFSTQLAVVAAIVIQLFLPVKARTMAKIIKAMETITNQCMPDITRDKIGKMKKNVVILGIINAVGTVYLQEVNNNAINKTCRSLETLESEATNQDIAKDSMMVTDSGVLQTRRLLRPLVELEGIICE
ncbi:hypothetical protein SK128_021289, partial [Halocaridina rubra]